MSQVIVMSSVIRSAHVQTSGDHAMLEEDRRHGISVTDQNAYMKHNIMIIECFIGIGGYC